MTPTRNVFACLVHESQECVIDLVHNLRSLDPGSAILLYNGGADPRLLTHGFPFERYGAVVFPHPRRMVWGRLHGFAVDCMRFLLASAPFDTMTIVDSDQLAIRPDYSAYLDRHVGGGAFGMLVNSPMPQGRNTDIGPLRTAYEEMDLWRSFFRRFTGPADEAFHWSYWPATVFSAEVARALVAVFDTDRELQDTLARSGLWATEEVLFPTLTRLLGYELRAHPCRYEYIRYAARYSDAEVDAAFADPGAFWVHPVPRRYDDGLRRRNREQAVFGSRSTSPAPRSGGIETRLARLEPLIALMREVPGWFDDDEARLLAEACAEALATIARSGALVEVGSHRGRSTVVLASVVAASGTEARLYAIDPHDGVVGALDGAIQSGPPTLEALKSTLATAGLAGVVRIIAARASEVAWSEPIAFLLIDGLHDYTSVARDFLMLEPYLVPGALVAFHGYRPDYPGVQAFVDELLGTRRYALRDGAGSLVVVARLPEAMSGSEASVNGDAADARAALTPATASHRTSGPLVSCIMPTADRPEFVARAIDCFLKQDYEYRELIVLDDGAESVEHLVPVDPRIHYGRARGHLSLGAKRNLACERASGTFIAHWDDDDWYAGWRLSYQVRALAETPRAVICGVSTPLFFDPITSRAWRYTWSGPTGWVHGATFCYRRSFWERVRFLEISEGEDVAFLRATSEAAVLSLDQDTFYVGTIHARNASVKRTESAGWVRWPEDLVKQALGDDWPAYLGLGFSRSPY